MRRPSALHPAAWSVPALRRRSGSGAGAGAGTQTGTGRGRVLRTPSVPSVLLPALGMLAVLALFAAACDDDPGDTGPSAGADATTAGTGDGNGGTTAPPGDGPFAPETLPLAPDGRPADPDLAALVEFLLAAPAGELAERYPDLVARRYTNDGAETLLDAAAWSARLRSGTATLYAVSRGDAQIVPPRDVDIALAVEEEGARRGWTFAVAGDRIVDLLINDEPWAPGVNHAYGRFLVLPPAEALPRPPASHLLSAERPRTGDGGVDALAAALWARDGAALTAALAPEVVERGCNGEAEPLSQARATNRLDRLSRAALGLRLVAEVPEGYVPTADYALAVVAVTDRGRYDYAEHLLLVRADRIVGMSTGCAPLPPFALPVPPPAEGDAVHPPGTRSGLPAVDRVLAAIEGGDPAAVRAAFAFAPVACVTEPSGIGSPPICRPGEAPGTPVDVVILASCEGSYARADEVGDTLERLLSPELGLYAVVEHAPDDVSRPAFEARTAVILGPRDREAPPTPDTNPPAALRLLIDDDGITVVFFGCGPESAEGLLFRWSSAPPLLLAPPDAA